MAITEAVVVKNNTGADVTIYSLGYTVASGGGTQDLFADNNATDEVFNDEVRGLIEDGSLVFLFHTQDLSTTNSLLLFDYKMIRPPTIAEVNPTINDDRSLGYLRNSLWTNKLTGKSFICSSYATGAAVWDALN